MRIAEIFRSIQGEGRLTGTESIFVRTSGCNLRCRYCDTPYASWTPEGEDLSVAEILGRIDELRLAAPPTFLHVVQKLSSPFRGGADVRKLPSPFGRGAGGEGVGRPRALESVPLQSLAPHPSPRHIVLTGGEPMLSAELIPLAAALWNDGWHITIETSGTLYLPVACHLMSISPKLSNSTPPLEKDPQWTWRHTFNRHAPEVIRRLTAEYDYQMKFVIDTPDDCREVETYLLEFPQIEPSRMMLMPQGVDVDILAQKSAWIDPYCLERGFQFCPRRQVEWFGAARGM